jgi:hypothetical protein
MSRVGRLGQRAPRQDRDVGSQLLQGMHAIDPKEPIRANHQHFSLAVKSAYRGVAGHQQLMRLVPCHHA